MEIKSKGLNQPVSMEAKFAGLADNYFFPSHATSYDPAGAAGTVAWKRYLRKPRLSFNQIDYPFTEATAWEFPEEYRESPETPFSLEFVSERTIRLRVSTRNPGLGRRGATGVAGSAGAANVSDAPSLMLTAGVAENDPTAFANCQDNGGEIVYSGPAGSVTVVRDPWKIVFRDASGRILTETRHFKDGSSLLNTNGLPFSFTRSSADMSHHLAASFLLRPDEKLFGGGESFTRLNKRGQRLDLFTTDALGVQTGKMYKPIPFFLSNEGYGMFVHTSAPLTFDFGATYDDTNTIYTGEEELDLFVFLGSPKEILSEYTRLTGRSPLPPLWSFGLWMSRITYSSEAEVREVAAKLRELDIPCDVIHLDTGWFETDWRCNYEFSPSRFDDPGAMIADLKEQGYRISLWQLPYFTPNNSLYAEILERGFAVRMPDGSLPTEDAILDFSHPEAVAWYQEKLAGLLALGVGAIKVDFGEAAPLGGIYASGRSGFHEHNLYPLRYNKAAAEVTERVNGESIIWARSAWAGSQRYPLHWGGDAENTDSAMAATLRAGLSLGLSGFPFWSHDIGGFVHSSPEELYSRWLPFGMLTSHSRCHGAPPTEPWGYSEAFQALFRETVKLKYALLPYVYTEAKLCSDSGYPLMRALFVEFPDDPGSWLIEDEYMFGANLLVAPLFEDAGERQVYLPPGEWFDYQSGERYAGGRWHKIAAGKLRIVVLVRGGAVIPHAKPALSTAFMDWSELEFVVFGGGGDSDGGKDDSGENFGAGAGKTHAPGTKLYNVSVYDPQTGVMRSMEVPAVSRTS
ncbi:TIM-barrel domain-containing protein [Paenibacillus macerans]|uniref:glycoside hydrolase family 31 protein n=1 Tax=Paenibacillus macerans TaxID=44252 RepID=UPI003D3142F8